MADAPVEMKPTLGLTGLTMNAMALIAPGAFLWLTFFIQATTGVTGASMWIGIVVALLILLSARVFPLPAAPAETAPASKPRKRPRS